MHARTTHAAGITPCFAQSVFALGPVLFFLLAGPSVASFILLSFVSISHIHPQNGLTDPLIQPHPNPHTYTPAPYQYHALQQRRRHQADGGTEAATATMGPVLVDKWAWAKRALSVVMVRCVGGWMLAVCVCGAGSMEGWMEGWMEGLGESHKASIR